MYLPLVTDSATHLSVSVECWHRYIQPGELHPDYKFQDLAQILNISDEHQNNILAIVSNMIEFGWNAALNLAYNTSSKDHTEPDFVNLDGEILSHLQVILNLLVTKEHFFSESEILFNPKTILEGKYGKSSLVKEQQVKVKEDKYLKKELIDYTIKYHLEQLSSPIFDYIHHQLPDFPDLTISNIGELLSSFAPSITQEELKHRFIKDVCDTVLRYLKDEADSKAVGANLSKEQGELIYSLLLLFNMVTLDHHKLHDTPRNKAKYITTFFKTDSDSKRRTFLQQNDEIS